MSDLQESTELTGGSGQYQAELSASWEGIPTVPAGGYLAALALRAAGRESGLARPVGFHCCFLQSPKSGSAVQLEVKTLRRTKRTAALRVSMSQASEPMLEAMVWTAVNDLPGYDFSALEPEVKARPEDWESIEVTSSQMLSVSLQHVETRSPHKDPGAPGAHTEPVTHAWHRFRPKALYGDPFVDAARLLFLADFRAFSPVAYQTGVGPMQVPFFAPNMDLTVQFCRPSSHSSWLLATARALAAAQGTIATRVEVWSEQSEPLAVATSTLMCRPNPFMT